MTAFSIRAASRMIAVLGVGLGLYGIAILTLRGVGLH